jgi:hypothetical protein
MLALYRIARVLDRHAGLDRRFPRAVALLFFLSPAAIFISGFHCNSDPLLMMFVVLAVAAAVEQRPVLCGLAIGAASGVKIIALIVSPLLFLAFRGRQRLALTLAGVAAGLLIFVPGFIVSGPLFLKQVFAYTGMPGRWGVRLLTELLTGNVPASIAVARLSTYALLAGVALLYVIFARRNGEPALLPHTTGLLFLLILALAPGFGVQYYFWILPFLVFTAPRRMAIALNAIVSGYLFVYYTAYSGGWPWWFAEPPADRALARMVVNWGIIPWLAIVAAAIASGIALWKTKGDADRVAS